MHNDVQQGERMTVTVLDLVKPPQKEIDEHELTHLRFRKCCRDFVKARQVKESPRD